MNLEVKARRAVIYANGARARHKKSLSKQREAVKLVAKVLMRENQRAGHSYTRQQMGALNGV